MLGIHNSDVCVKYSLVFLRINLDEMLFRYSLVVVNL